MEYTNFGKAGVRVSRMALGMGLRGQDDPAEAQRMIEHAMAQGINLIDCANIYGLMDDRAYVRVSESILGKAIKGKRDDVMITSKVAQVIGPGENDYSLSRYHIIREAERSLKNIGTDHIDFYICHVFDPNTPSGFIIFSALTVTCPFSFLSSKTASIIKSHSFNIS